MKIRFGIKVEDFHQLATNFKIIYSAFGPHFFSVFIVFAVWLLGHFFYFLAWRVPGSGRQQKAGFKFEFSTF